MNLIKAILVRIGYSGSWQDSRFRLVRWLFRVFKGLRGA